MNPKIATIVMLSEAKHLDDGVAEQMEWKCEILRCAQNDKKSNIYEC